MCVPPVVMSEESELLKKRTMRFALDVCALIKHLPTYEPGPTVRRQSAKSATSVAFNYSGAVQTFIVPARVTAISVAVYGAAGGWPPAVESVGHRPVRAHGWEHP